MSSSLSHSINSFQFTADVVALEKREPAFEVDGLSRFAVGEFRVGVQAGAAVVVPGSVEWFPGGDDPAVAVGGAGEGVRAF